MVLSRELEGFATAEAELDREYSATNGRSMVWGMVALSAPDQLRQRAAWALSQVFVVSYGDLGLESVNELWHTCAHPQEPQTALCDTLALTH